MAIAPICNITVPKLAKLRTPPDSFHFWKWMTCSLKNGWKVEFVGRACWVSRRCSSLQIGKRGLPLLSIDDFSNICSAFRKDHHLYSQTLNLQIRFWISRISSESFFSSMRDHGGGIFSGSKGIWVNAQFWSKETPLSMLIPVHSSSSLCLSIWFPLLTNSCKVGSNSLYTNSYGEESNWPTICFILLSFSLSSLFRDLIPKVTNIVRQGFYITTVRLLYSIRNFGPTAWVLIFSLTLMNPKWITTHLKSSTVHWSVQLGWPACTMYQTRQFQSTLNIHYYTHMYQLR